MQHPYLCLDRVLNMQTVIIIMDKVANQLQLYSVVIRLLYTQKI